MAGHKAGEVNGPRGKQVRLNKPTRGLVFGMTSREIALSESGKPLRVENGCVGRPGGVYVNKNTKQGSENVSVQNGEKDGESSLLGSNDNLQQGEVEMQSDPSKEVTGLVQA